MYVQEKTADNVFRKKGAGWLVRYAGQEDFILIPTKGALYLQILLSNPGRQFSVIEIVDRDFEKCNRCLGCGGEMTDHESIEAYWKRYIELSDSLAQAEENNDIALCREIQKEIRWLTHELECSRDLNGRIRRHDDRERIRKAVQAAIRRTIREIVKHDKAFASHLKSRLKCGLYPRYDPIEDIEWET